MCNELCIKQDWTTWTHIYAEDGEVADCAKWGYYKPSERFMALTVLDIWWKYEEPSDRNSINIIKCTDLNQNGYVMKNDVKCLKSKSDIDACLDDVIIFDTPSFQRMWQKRDIINDQSMNTANMQRQIKEILWQRLKHQEKENKKLQSEKAKLENRIKVE